MATRAQAGAHELDGPSSRLKVRPVSLDENKTGDPRN
jgi:hypothetical protein